MTIAPQNQTPIDDRRIGFTQKLRKREGKPEMGDWKQEKGQGTRETGINKDDIFNETNFDIPLMSCIFTIPNHNLSLEVLK